MDRTADLGSYMVSAYKGGPQQFYGHFSYTVHPITIKLRMLAFIWTLFLQGSDPPDFGVHITTDLGLSMDTFPTGFT